MALSFEDAFFQNFHNPFSRNIFLGEPQPALPKRIKHPINVRQSMYNDNGAKRAMNPPIPKPGVSLTDGRKSWKKCLPSGPAIMSILTFTKPTNKWMKRIAKTLGFDVPVTTYAACHSFSTVLKRSGASTEFISEALGNTDVRTTQSYLDSFENETKKQFAANLSDFKKDKNINID